MNPEPLNEEEIDRLEALLEADWLEGKAMYLDEIQAYLCAVASGPELVSPSLWLPQVLAEGNDLTMSNEPELSELIELLMRLYNDVVGALHTGQGVAPILYPQDESDEEIMDYMTWANAYIFGANLAGDWFELAGKKAETLSELLQPLFLLNGMLKEDAEKNGERWYGQDEEARLMARAQDALPQLVQMIYDFWQSGRSPVATVQRDEPKVGRNELCPCGSGKKYKQCCGSPGRLH